MPDRTLPTDLAAAAAALPADRAGWCAALTALTEDEGHFEPVGAHHHALFLDQGPTLLVTFEDAAALRARQSDHAPLALRLAAAHGWSALAILSEGETWFRDLALYRHVDRLVDDAFFDDFDRVLFFGARMGGYGAAAYSVAAPGAQALLLSPRATLDPARAGWDPREARHRRLCFTDRYGYGPDMTDGAARVFVAFDPAESLDAMHASLFLRPHAVALRARRLGDRLDHTFAKMGILDGLIVEAMEGRLTRASFAQALRRRRVYGPYLRHMLTLADTAGRPGQARGICRSVVARIRAPMFRNRLTELETAAVRPPAG
jgi:hypothetical protein